jgi:hypothetical protein
MLLQPTLTVFAGSAERRRARYDVITDRDLRDVGANLNHDT